MIRISKYLAQRNICSRRDAERWIEAGRVTLNGEPIVSPVTFVQEGDQVCVDGTPVAHETVSKLWVYYKPCGEITSHKDPQGRRTVFETMNDLGLPRVISVGRLDINSEGLLLLTTDSDLAHRLEHSHQERIYRVRIFGCPSREDFLRQGAKEQEAGTFRFPMQTVDGVRYLPFTLAFEQPLANSEEPHNIWCTMTLTEGKNREIRKLMTSFGFQVNRLIRLRYGSFSLGSLQPGQLREVSVASANLPPRSQEDASESPKKDEPSRPASRPEREGASERPASRRPSRPASRPERTGSSERPASRRPSRPASRPEKEGSSERPASRRPSRPASRPERGGSSDRPASRRSSRPAARPEREGSSERIASRRSSRPAARPERGGSSERPASRRPSRPASRPERGESSERPASRRFAGHAQGRPRGGRPSARG